MKKVKYIAIPVIFLGLIVAVLAYNKSQMKANATNNIQDVFYVTVDKAVKQDVSEHLSLVGTVIANNDVNIVSETQGKVTGLYMKVGDYKSGGSVLVQVDDELKKAAYMSAEANYEKTKKDYERFQELYKTKSTTDAQLDAAKLAYSVAESQYIIAKRQYNDTKITTPISGLVTMRNVDVGTMVQPGMVVANVVDISKLKVKVNVAEEDAFKLKVGDKVEVTTDVYPGVTLTGHVETISAKGDDAHTYPVEIVIVNEKNHPLKAGMFARINFTSFLKDNSLTIPRDALVGSIRNPQVYVVENGVAKLHDLVISGEVNKKVLVLNGLHEGDEVVVSGQNTLSDDVKVKVL